MKIHFWASQVILLYQTGEIEMTASSSNKTGEIDYQLFIEQIGFHR